MFGLELVELPCPLQDLELSYRPLELRSRIEQAYAELRPIHMDSVPKPLPDGAVQYFDVHITPVQEPSGKVLGVGISYTDVTHYRRLDDALQRANQELETTNEELQSTNEELETMNEELQSINEELETLNEEQRQLVSELNDANAFRQSILSSLHAAIVVVDPHLSILGWNRKAEDLWGIRSDEVMGQPFLSQDIGLPVDRLQQPLQAILSGEQEYQEQVLDATNRRGKGFKCQVSCSPLLSSLKQRQGAILLMKEID